MAKKTEPKPLPTEEQILARFFRLNATIRLSRTKFGYIATGRADLITRLQEGHRLRPATRKRVGEVLDEIEREHSVPVQKSNQD